MDSTKLRALFGSSAFMTVMGIIAFLGGLADLLKQAIDTNGMPTDTAGWLALVVGVLGMAGKGANESHAIQRAAVSSVVVAAPGATVAEVPVLVPKLIGWLIIPLALTVGSACALFEHNKLADVMVKLEADARTAAVAGCAARPTIDVLLTTILEFLPEGTDKTKLQSGITLTADKAEALCSKIAPMPAGIRSVPLRRQP